MIIAIIIRPNINGKLHFRQTNADEMCNFYLMYYVKEGVPLDMKYCGSEGPPYFYWSNPENDLNSIPDKEASTLYI